MLKDIGRADANFSLRLKLPSDEFNDADAKKLFNKLRPMFKLHLSDQIYRYDTLNGQTIYGYVNGLYPTIVAGFAEELWDLFISEEISPELFAIEIKVGGWPPIDDEEVPF